MKRFKISLIALVGILFGCQQAELVAPEENGAVKMKTVTVSAGIDGTDTKASLDSQTGAFTWQSGDLISVLATDGKFYDFILKGEHGTKTAEFEGSIPEEANVTTLATYPRIVANGTTNTVLAGNTLNYVLPATWNYAKDVSNVPMVATFGEGADHMSFKQVGGVMRFPVKNLPAEAKFVVTMNDKTITGEFPVDIAALGESCMVAGTEASELVINYVSDVDGADAEFNVPVPTGVYNKFTVTIKDASDNVLFTKNYSKENTVKRATLLNMTELVLPERAMVISEVWPFFVDARVVFSGIKGVDQYAFYIDGAETPVIIPAEELDNGMAGGLIGGEFAHASTHTVAVAKVVDGTPVLESKSEAVEFTTADIRQLTTNTGTKFVSVGWDDVSIDGGPKYVNGKWTTVSSANYPDLDAQGRKLHQTRGYQVQLLAADKTTIIYDMIPFDGHSIHQNAYYDSSSLGQIEGNNILNPTALSFGYLEPGTDYYFRVKTIDGEVEIDFEKGDYIAADNEAKPYPYPIEKIIERYHKSLKNIKELIEVCDILHVYDNSIEPVRIIRKHKDDVSIFPNEYWTEEKILELASINEYAKFIAEAKGWIIFEKAKTGFEENSKFLSSIVLDNATAIFKKLMATKTESTKGEVDKDELHDELDILKKIMPSKLSSSNLTTIVKKVIASLGDDDRNEDNVLDVLKGFNNIDLGSVTSIVKKLL